MEHGDMTAGGTSAFDVVLRGYDRRQVDDHLAGMEQRLSATAAQASELRGQRDSAAGRVRELEGGPRPAGASTAPSLDGFGAHVESILRVASDEAAAIRRRAEESVRHHAEAQEKLRSNFQGIAERLEPLVSRLEQESTSARAAQTAIGSEMEALHKSAQEQAAALVAAVLAATTRMRADAETRVEVSARQTADVREELALVRQVLAQLDPEDAPDPATPGQGGQVPLLKPAAAASTGPAGKAATAPAQTVPAPTGGPRSGKPSTDGDGRNDDETGPVPVVTDAGPRPDAVRPDAPTETITMPAGVGTGVRGSSGRNGPTGTGR